MKLGLATLKEIKENKWTLNPIIIENKLLDNVSIATYEDHRMAMSFLHP